MSIEGIPANNEKTEKEYSEGTKVEYMWNKDGEKEKGVGTIDDVLKVGDEIKYGIKDAGGFGILIPAEDIVQEVD